MEGLAETGSGGHLVPLLNGVGGGLDASLLRRLYAGHFLARWGARMWEFSVGLYMIRVWPGSLLFAAVYGVVESASVAVFGPMVGTLVDSLTYLQVLGLWLLVQSLSFIVAGVSVTALLVYDDLKVTSFPVFVALVVVTNVSGALAALSTLAGTILIEREWVVVMCSGHPPVVLTRINSAIRRIDLSCKLLAPVLSGFVISFVSTQASAVALALWNVASVWLVYWLFVSVYNGVPALSANSLARDAAAASAPEVDEAVQGYGRDASDWSERLTTRLSILPCWESWAVYARQEVMLPGVALAILYFSVLSFGTLMTATLDWEGIPAYVISPGVQRHGGHRGDRAVPGRARAGVHAPDGALVHLDAVVLPAALRRLRLGERPRGVGVGAHGRRCRVAPRPLDVRLGRHAADAGRRAGRGPVRRGRGPELAAVRVRPAHLRHGHHRLRPQGFRRAHRAVVRAGDLRCGHVHAARVPRAEAPVPPGQDLRQDAIVMISIFVTHKRMRTCVCMTVRLVIL